MKRRTAKLIILSILALTIAGIGLWLYFKPINHLPDISFYSYKYENASMYTQSSSGSVSGISNLDIHWISGEVEIILYDGNNIKFEEHSERDIPSDIRMCFWKDGNTLRIQYTASANLKTVNVRKNLYVYVPVNSRIDELNVDVTSANVRISGLNVNEADFETVSGDFILDSFVARDISFDATSGNLKAENVGFVSFDGDSVSGGIALSLIPTCRTEEIEIDSVSGNIELSMPDGFGYALALDTVSGDILCSDDVQIISKNKLIHGNGFTEIHLDTVSGDVCIK